MDNDPILDAGQIDPEWLAGVLRASGDLREGRVSSVEAVQDTSTHATNARLLVRYSEDAIGRKPSSLFLKLCKPESSLLFGRTEIDLYAKIGAPMADSPVPKCYHYAYAENSGRYHLLLQDLSDTHHHNWDVEPTADSARKTAAGLANMHAWWWDHPQIVEDERYPTAAVIRRYRAQIDRGLAPMLDYLGDRISQETRDILARVFVHHGRRMIERAEEGRHLTYNSGRSESRQHPFSQRSGRQSVCRRPAIVSMVTRRLDRCRRHRVHDGALVGTGRTKKIGADGARNISRDAGATRS